MAKANVSAAGVTSGKNFLSLVKTNKLFLGVTIVVVVFVFYKVTGLQKANSLIFYLLLRESAKVFSFLGIHLNVILSNLDFNVFTFLNKSIIFLEDTLNSPLS